MNDHQRSSAGSRRRSSSELRSQIAATRARLAADIEAARTKLSRRGLEHEAMSALRTVRSGASGAVSGFGASTDRQAGQLGRLAVDTVKRYPVITTLVGVGLALLALRNGRRSAPRPQEARPEDEVPFVRPTERADLPPGR
jgi:hypothetical protein